LHKKGTVKMSERKQYMKFVDKLESLSKENELSVRFYPEEYPLRLTIKPYTGVGSQMSLLENMEERGTHPNAVITMTYIEGDVDYNVSARFSISDNLLGGYTKAFKNLCTAWQALILKEIHTSGMVRQEDLSSIDEEARDNG